MQVRPSPMQALGILILRVESEQGPRGLRRRSRAPAHGRPASNRRPEGTCRDRRRLVGLARGPGADAGKRGHDRIVRRKKKVATARGGPVGQIVAAGLQLIADLVDAGDAAGGVLRDEPIPERRAEIEPVMQVLRLDEDVRVEQETDQISIPASRPMLLNVSVFETPSMRKASRYSVCPSSVLSTSARANRRLTRESVVR